jgi:hypothetical protein
MSNYQEIFMLNKKTIVAILLASASILPAVAQAQSTGCAAKKDEIRQQIDYAKAHGNSYRVAGLEKAYSEVEANCTDASLKRDREADVRKKEQKVAEQKQELAEAQATGREDKIGKRMRKLEDAQRELAEAKAQLNK